MSINLNNTKAAFRAASENSQAVEDLNQAISNFYNSLGVELSPEEQKYVITDILNRSSSESQPSIRLPEAGALLAAQ
ncbi:MAG: hypothetical protein F6K21_04730 [Symploca sp. SIO2D2]|nr:hypothetical protein [Symploca sp. SIO2D2]